MATPIPPLPAPVATVVTPPTPQIEYKILVEPIFELSGGFFARGYRRLRHFVRRLLKRGKLEFPVQNHPFRLGLDISNLGNQPSPPCRLRNIQIGKVEEGGLRTFLREEFHVDNLNPNERTRLWIGSLTTPAEGVVWVSAELIPQTPNAYVTTFQRDQGTGQIDTSPGVTNNWGVGWFIQPRLELQQARTNNLIALLTLLLVLEAVFGLKNIAVGILHLIQAILLWAAGLLGVRP